jgi:ribonuclease R
LRSMQQALYSAIEAPHFGLAYERYAHFTSPIRRLPDLINHRLIKEVMESTDKPATGNRKPQNDALKTSAATDNAPTSQIMLEGLASSASETERRADKASQDINQFLRCQYLVDCLGECYEGRVAHVSKLGAFVLLDELAIEGLIPFRAIRDQLGRLSVLPYALVSDATGKRLSMGDEVNVQLSRVDEKLGHIEFELVEQKTSRSRHLAKPRRFGSSEFEKAGKRRKGLQTKRSFKQGRTEVTQHGPETRDEKTDGSSAAPQKSRAKQSQAAQRPAKRSGAKQGKKSPQNSRVVEQGVTKKADAKRGSKQSVDNPVKAAKRPPPKRSSSKGPSPKNKGEPLTADRSSTRKPFKRRISKGKTK